MSRDDRASPEEQIELRKSELRKKIAQGLDSLGLNEGIDGDEFFAQLAREEEALERPSK